MKVGGGEEGQEKDKENIRCKKNTDISVPTLSVDMSVSLASSFLRSFTHPRFATFSLYCVCVGRGVEGGGRGREGKEGYYVIHA